MRRALPAALPLFLLLCGPKEQAARDAFLLDIPLAYPTQTVHRTARHSSPARGRERPVPSTQRSLP